MLDAGICGHDWVVENGADVVEGARGAARLRHPYLPPPCIAQPAPHASIVPPCSTTPPPAVCELQYSKATSNPACWVLAVPEDSPVQRAEDLAGTIVASELVQTTKK